MARLWHLLGATLLAGALLGATLAAAAPSPGPVAVAVLDSGIDAAHGEFQGRPIERHSFVTPTVPPVPGVPGLPVDPFSLRQDPDGQGTGVASVVAGQSLGIAPEAALVDLQVSARYTGVALDPAAESAAAQALDWLIAHHGGNGSAGPRIALLSFANRTLSGPGAESLEAQAGRLWAEGVLVVVPMGGNGTLHRSPYVLTVGDLTAPCNENPAGPTKPDLVAPGSNIDVANPKDPAKPTAPTTVQRSGSPYAAAAVAGAAAKVWQARADLPIAALTAILRDTSQTSAGAGCGTLDVDAAVAAATAWQDPIPKDPLAKPTPGWTTASAVVGLAVVALLRRRT